MKRSLPIAVAVALAACRAPQRPAARGGVAFTVQGAVEGAPLQFGVDDLPSLPRRSVTARDPHVGREVRYDGVNAAALFDGRVQVRKGADMLVVHCRDGYEVAIPMSAVARYEPVLADSADGRPLSQLKYDVALGPLYLVWPNVDEPGLDADPRVNPWWWAFEVVELELVASEGTCSRALRPPPGASDAARLGSDQYGIECIESCSGPSPARPPRCRGRSD